MTKIVENFLFPEESYKIRGACFDVWKQFRGSFKESIVDKALTLAMQARRLTVEDQKRINIYYLGEKVGVYVPDKIVNGIILIEVKFKVFSTLQDIRTFWDYLKASDYKLGFFVNYSPKKLEIKRVVYDTARKRN